MKTFNTEPNRFRIIITVPSTEPVAARPPMMPPRTAPSTMLGSAATKAATAIGRATSAKFLVTAAQPNAMASLASIPDPPPGGGEPGWYGGGANPPGGAYCGGGA